jgi:threonine dehydrogenase-like Zn-dependent dehydrogenase
MSCGNCRWCRINRESLCPGGHLKFLHLWPGQNPPGADGRNVWIVTRNRWSLQGGWPRVSSDSFCL